MSGVNNKANIWAVMGSTGGGKGNTVKVFLQKSKIKRLIVWDAMSEYSEFGQVVTTLAGLYNEVTTENSYKKSFKIIFSFVSISKTVFCFLIASSNSSSLII